MKSIKRNWHYWPFLSLCAFLPQRWRINRRSQLIN